MKQQKAPLTRLDRILTGIGIALCVLLIPCLIINVTMIIQSYVNEDEVPSFLGVTPLIVLSGSMEPKIHEGELIFSTDISPEDVREEMVISFFDPLSTTGTIVTHKVVEIIENEDGTRSFRTFRKYLANNASRYGIANIEFEGCNYILFRMDKADGRELVAGLAERVKREGINTAELVGHNELPLFEKYDTYIPGDLLRKAYAADRLRPDEAETRILEIERGYEND
jgi:signal peptidase I